MGTAKFTKATKEIHESYRCYKVGDIAVNLFLAGVSQEDIDYILADGKSVAMKPYDKLQAYLAGAMDRMQERLPMDEAVAVRQGCACCLGGKREQIAKQICANNDTIQSRFEAFSKERYIIGGKAWQEGEDYYITYWLGKPAEGYSCACVKHVPTQPMNKLWCECCAQHIKSHFQTALGVKAECECLTSVLTSCGQDACLFKLNIKEVIK